MEERRLNNHTTDNCERDFRLSEGIAKNDNHANGKYYGRDLLLQLRLHPLSLQKPKNLLPDVPIVKERLYLHDINETCPASPNKNMETSGYTALSKPEYSNVRHQYPLYPHYMNRLNPYYYSSQLYNGPCHGTSSKFRPPYHTSYCNPLNKHCVVSHQCYKDFPVDECMWSKQCASSGDLWSSHPSYVHSKLVKKKDCLETIPKTKKQLSIIDPVTGKNILEAVTNPEDEKQKDSISVQENAESAASISTVCTGEKYAGDYFYNGEFNEEPSSQTSVEASTNSCSDSTLLSTINKIYCDKLKSSDTSFEEDIQRHKENSNLEGTDDNKSAQNQNNSKDENVVLMEKVKTMTSMTDSVVAPENTNELAKYLEDTHENYVTSAELLSKKEHKVCHHKESSHAEKNINAQAPDKKEYNMHACKENVSKQNDKFKSKDKFSLKQEQQKMAIIQSFLRYKKYRLEENERNLDEERIKIANWEWNLMNKAKRLHDKELWLEAQTELLLNRAQQLSDKEKMLKKEESRSASTPKDTLSPENNITAVNEFHGFMGYALNPNKISEPFVERSKSEVTSLDESESNVLFVEKMNLYNESGDTSIENNIELATQKKDETDPLGPSKGRHYLPEHIKYWFNKRDKSSL